MTQEHRICLQFQEDGKILSEVRHLARPSLLLSSWKILLAPSKSLQSSGNVYEGAVEQL